MHPDVQHLVISQLLFIIAPIGTLFAIWLWILSMKRQ